MRTRRSQQRREGPVVLGRQVLRWAGRTALVIMVLALLGLGLYIWPLVNDKPSWFQTVPYRWVVMGEDRGSAALLYSLDKEGLVALTIPHDVVVTATGSMGEYKVGSLVGLGRLEDSAEKVVVASLTSTLRLAIRGAVVTDSDLSDELSGLEALARARKSMLSALLGTGKSGMHRKDVFVVWRRLQELGIDQVDVYKGEDLPIVVEEMSVDGETLKRLDTASFVRYYNTVMVTRGIFEASEISLWVENSTEIGGIGAETAEILEADGYDVVGVSDGKGSLPYTIIMVDSSIGFAAPVIKEMQWLFPAAEWRVSDQSDYRAKVVIRLGVASRGVWMY